MSVWTGIGYVYAVHDEGRGLVKIGCSAHPEKRIAIVERECKPVFPLTMLAVVKVPWAYCAEQALHVHFKAFRAHGEWFKLHPAAIMEIATPERVIAIQERVTREWWEEVRRRHAKAEWTAEKRKQRSEKLKEIWPLRKEAAQPSLDPENKTAPA